MLALESSHPSLEPSEGDPVVDLVSRCIDAFEERGMLAVDEILREQPTFAARVRSRLESLIAAGLLEAPREPEFRAPERLGAFRLIEKLGGGGMGVVYRAEQDGLGRIVALKLIRPEHLYFEGARARFQREVETVARLSHPGIVQIHTVGEADGIPYFAMELVKGASLSEILRFLTAFNPNRLRGRDLLEAAASLCNGKVDLRSDDAAALVALDWSDASAFVARRVADALAHAHERGVLHRDVKPSNVMLTPDGRILLLDFGLATIHGADGITKSGSQLGSLAYMSPEALDAGSKVDARSDVYSLGVMFYELLTLQTPYRSDTTAGAIRAILDGDAPPPRSVNPRVSTDAETVCQVAMAREPQRRYRDAEAVARDLSNVVARRPLEAKRPGALRRAHRFAMRHKGATAAIAFGVLAFIVAPGFLAWREFQARLRIGDALEKESNARRTSEADFARAREVLTLVQARVGAPGNFETPELDTLVRGILSDVLPVFREFVVEHAGDPTLRSELADAARRVAEIESRLGNYGAAATAIGEAIELAESNGSRGTDRAARLALAEYLTLGADIDESLGRLDDVEAKANRVLALLDSGIDEPRAETSAAPQAALLVATAFNTRGAVAAIRGDLAPAERDTEDAIARFTEVMESDPTAVDAQDGLASSLSNLGFILNDRGEYDRAIERFRAALAGYEALIARHGDRASSTFSIVRIRVGLSHAYSSLGNTDAAIAEGRRIISEFTPLVERWPSRSDWRRELSVVHASLAAWLLRYKDNDGALASATRAAELMRPLTIEFTDVPDHFGNLSAAELNVGAALLAKNDLPGHREALRRALAAIERAIELEPQQLDWHDRFRDILYRLGLAEIASHDVEPGAAIAERLAGLDRSDPMLVRKSAGLLAYCAKFTLRKAGLTEEQRTAFVAEFKTRALRRLEDAITIGFRDVADLDAASDMAGLRDDPRFAKITAPLRVELPGSASDG